MRLGCNLIPSRPSSLFRPPRCCYFVFVLHSVFTRKLERILWALLWMKHQCITAEVPEKDFGVPLRALSLLRCLFPKIVLDGPFFFLYFPPVLFALRLLDRPFPFFQHTGHPDLIHIGEWGSGPEKETPPFLIWLIRTLNNDVFAIARPIRAATLSLNYRACGSFGAHQDCKMARQSR